MSSFRRYLPWLVFLGTFWTLARSYLDPTGGGIIMALILAGSASPMIIARLFLGRFRRHSPDSEKEQEGSSQE